jgi:hypothetical protein
MRTLVQFFVLTIFLSSCNKKDQDFYKISVDEFRDKMMGAWIGQMAGVGWGQPTEMKYRDVIIPADKVPVWQSDMINEQGNDDLYVEMTFLSSMERYGLDVSRRQAGIDFANTGYGLWCANMTGRENLRYGIAPPESSHPEYSNNCDDIDYQIEADFSGIIAPGMPNVPVEMGEKFGRDSIWENHLTEELYQTDIQLQAILGELVLPLGEMLNWKVGSQVVFPTTVEDELELRCGHFPIFRGPVGQKQGHIAVRIENYLSPENEDDE